MKSPRHAAMWSNSCDQSVTEFRARLHLGIKERTSLIKLSDLLSGPQHHFLWDGADLTVHLQDLLLLLHHADVKHAEVGPTQVQGQEVALLCHQIEVITANNLEGKDDYNHVLTEGPHLSRLVWLGRRWAAS